jgi:hypothetical protein
MEPVIDMRTVQPLEIDHLLTKPKLKSFIYRVGVELEGGWRKLPKGVVLDHDGSINGLKIPDRELLANPTLENFLNIGELTSEPLELGKLHAWMKQFYPSDVNKTCGMHVHMSFFSALHYQWLMVPEYPATIRHHITQWAVNEVIPKSHCLWDRLLGQNEYCRYEFFPDAQASMRKKSYQMGQVGNRYTMINYCHGLNNRGTLECRLLPMMETVEQGTRAVQRVVDVTNACIAILAKREEKVTSKVKDDPGRVVVSKEVFV